MAGVNIEPSTLARMELYGAFKAAQIQSLANGTNKITMEEIDAEIAEYRQEKRIKSMHL